MEPSKSQEPRSTVTPQNLWTRILKTLRKSDVEVQDIGPVPLEERTSIRYINAFTAWCSINTNILAITFGMLGPVSFGLGLRDACLVILFFNLLSSLAPAYMSTWGPKTGMRQMVQARFSFGRHLVAIPILLNLATLISFSVIICVTAGECLAAASKGSLSPILGIVLVALIALFVSFWGFHVLHFFESYAWIPALAAVIVVVGCGAPQLHQQSALPAAEAALVLGFGGVVASYMLPWACIASDLTTYFKPAGGSASARIFIYSYLGLLLPTVLLMSLGAAIGGALPSFPDWQAGMKQAHTGGVLAAILLPVNDGFGRFVVVVLAFSLLANLSSTMYAITINAQALLAPWKWHVNIPRGVFSVIVTAMVIPLAIEAVADFFLNIEHLVALIGYWSASFLAIVLTEHWVFRDGGRMTAYSVETWDDASALPTGFAALGAGVLSFALVIPCMGQVWWTGPIAEVTGDIGFEVAFVLSGLLYVPLRWAEKRYLGRQGT